MPFPRAALSGSAICAPEDSAVSCVKLRAARGRRPGLTPKNTAVIRHFKDPGNRARLKARLEEAEARIAELEKSRALVVNRIDWLIDKLGSAVEKRA